MSDCVFCDIVAGKSPATYVMQGEGAIGIVPINPVTPGHVLFIPKIHVTDFAQVPVVSGKLVELAAAWWRGPGGGGPVNMITSRGREATQSVFHLHIHLVPRAKDDGLALPWYSGKGNHGVS